MILNSLDNTLKTFIFQYKVAQEGGGFTYQRTTIKAFGFTGNT
jgi:hypothetical protein